MRRGLVAAFVVLAAACGARRPSAPVAVPPVRIPFLPRDAGCCTTLEQRVVVTTPMGSSTFDVAVETHETEVVIVGFTTYGLRAFTVVHDADGLRVDAAPLPELRAVPFDRVVRDVYAAFLLRPGILPHTRCATITERWDGDILRARDVSFDPDSDRPDEVHVDYGPNGWHRGQAPPTDVVVSHDAVSLRIAITTRSASP